MKAAVIGLGPHGRRIVDVLGDLPGVELAAVVDRSESALASCGAAASAVRHRSADELWAAGGAELVCVATNGPSHAALAVAAIEAGAKHLLVEKPMACSLDECDAILAKAGQYGCRVAVDHARRYAPIYQWLREHIASGEWGELRTLWFQRPGIGLGCNATHSFDAVAYLAGCDAERVCGWIDAPIAPNPRGAQFVDPGGLVVMELPRGIRAVVAQTEDGAGPMSVELNLTAARVRMDEQSGAIEVIQRDLSVKPGPGRPALYCRAELPAGLSAKAEMGAMIRGCITDLISNGPLASDARHGRAAFEVLVAAYLSDRRGHAAVELPLREREELETWLPVT